MPKDVDIIKERLSVADVLRGYITLLPAGKNFKANCPFHQEKTPSFIVSPDRGRWHCFGCGEGGDIITFVMKYENLEFPEALRFLAEKAGVQLASVNPQHQREFGILYDINEEAKRFFYNSLVTNKDAISYLTNRGLTKETIQEFELGFSPGGESLSMHLIQKKYDVRDALRAGLVYRNTRGLYRDRFDSRIMFPIINHVGKTVAFTGRVFGSASENPDNPKYMNSPESPVFNKSKVLYGLNKSKGDIAREKSFVVVEGQMDFLMSWQCGIKNCVAISGTGFTEHHLERLRRLADTAIVSFDNDEAGRKALERTLTLFNKFDFHTKVISLGEFKDPADALLKDLMFMKNAIESAKPAFQYLFDLYFSSGKVKNDLALKKRVVRHIIEILATIKSSIEQSEWMRELSRSSGIPETSLSEELEHIEHEKQDGKAEEVPMKEKHQFERRIDIIARQLTSLAFTNDEFRGIVLENKEFMPRPFLSVLENPGAESATVFQMQSTYLFGSADHEELKKEALELIKQLKLEYYKAIREALQREIKEAGVVGDEEKLLEATRKFQECTQKMHQLS
ncbi:DNA primase [Candidatus Parcubacteria bacterium]|jgi:DNA primase|nr:MAG: DNA primase [Candidatus Parcubacteria bacterium]